MRRSLLVFTLVPLLTSASDLLPATTAGPRLGEVRVVTVAIPNLAALDEMNSEGFDISSRRGLVVELYATPVEVSRLEELGYAILSNELASARAKLSEGYHDYAEVTAILHGFADDYPNLTRLVSLGQSVEGRDLWALLITDNPNVEEAEPEVKYVATIHGDEPMGTEMTLMFAERLLMDYGTDGRVTDLVDTTAIWLVPLVNPDGLENGSRYNAQGLDLNRSFPHYSTDFTGTWYDGEAPDYAGRPPEVQHVMAWTLENSFVLSGQYHTGVLVANYPYDFAVGVPSGSYAISPDDALFREISLRYAEANPPMYNSVEFSQGITNGSAWYSVIGGMQDWNYRYAGVNEVTLEIASPKRPHHTLIPEYWEDNEESMFRYLESVHLGANGLVTDDTGAPLWAQVTVAGNTQPVFTDPDVGDYYRMLLPGTYDLLFEAEGYFAKTVSDVVVTEDSAALVDVVLVDADIDNSGAVGATDVQWVINAALGVNVPHECDVDGGGVTASDIQKIVNALLDAVAS